MSIVRLTKSSQKENAGRKGNSFYASGAPYNVATGGTVTEFISTGEAGTVSGVKYRVHEFTSNGQFTTVYQDNNFDFFLVGGGTSGGGGWSGGGGAGGQGGRVVSVTRSASQAGLSSGANAVTIGNAGDGNTTIGSLTSLTGGRANGGANPGGNSSNPGQAGTTTTIKGSSQTFGGGGGSGAYAASCGEPYGCWYGGGAGGAGGGANGGNALHWQGGGQALPGASASANTGGGGGGGGGSSQGFGAGGGTGGSGIAFIRYAIPN